MKKKHAFATLTIILFLMILVIMSFHRIPDNYNGHVCAENYQILGPFWVVLNCDAREFMRGAENLGNLLNPDFVRQSRPGTMVLVNLLSIALRPGYSLIDNTLAATGRSFHGLLNRWWHQYFSYVVLNVSVILVAIGIYVRSIGKEKISLPALFAGSLLIINSLVKAFLLTPHTAIFEILVPLVCIVLYLWVRAGHAESLAKVFLVSLLIGILSTAYLGFLIAAPTMIVADLLYQRASPENGYLLKVVLRGFVITFLMLIPIALWMMAISVRNGSFYAAEISGDELIWFVTALRINPFHAFATLLSIMGDLFVRAMKLAWPLLAVVIMSVLAVQPRRIREVINCIDPLLPVGALIVSFLCILFFGIIGLRIWHRSYLAVPPLIFLLGYLLEQIAGEVDAKTYARLSLGVAIAVFTSCVILFVQQGPYS